MSDIHDPLPLHSELFLREFAAYKTAMQARDFRTARFHLDLARAQLRPIEEIIVEAGDRIVMAELEMKFKSIGGSK